MGNGLPGVSGAKSIAHSCAFLIEMWWKERWTQLPSALFFKCMHLAKFLDFASTWSKTYYVFEFKQSCEAWWLEAALLLPVALGSSLLALCLPPCHLLQSITCIGWWSALAIASNMSATEHLSYFPYFNCSCSSCQNAVVYDDPHTMSMLSNQSNWWSCAFVGAFASVIAHLQGHWDDVFILFHFSFAKRWQPCDLPMSIQKILVLELTDEHYTLMIANQESQQATFLNGFTKKRKWLAKLTVSVSNECRAQTLKKLITSMNLGDLIAWNLERDFYLEQRDGSSCSPILILAFFEAYTGQAMFPGVGFGALYARWMHTALVNWYVVMYQHLEVQDELLALASVQSSLECNWQCVWLQLGLPGMDLSASDTDQYHKWKAPTVTPASETLVLWWSKWD